jgi:uncharacterized delta-60 repeat protein
MRMILFVSFLALLMLSPGVRAAPGDLDPTFDSSPAVDGLINALALQPDGKVIIGGQFETVRGIPRKNLARLNQDGSLDPSFQAEIGTNTCICIAILPNGKILASGGLGYPTGLRRLNSDGSLDPTFKKSIAMYGAILALVVQPDGKVVLGGDFFVVPQPGLPREDTFYKGVLRLEADGTLNKIYGGFSWDNLRVGSLALQTDGKLLVSDYYPIRYNADGTQDGTFDAGGLHPVDHVVAQQDGKVLVGGWLGKDGTSLSRIARLNGDGSIDASFKPGRFETSTANSIVLQPDRKILIGGAFTAIDGNARNGIARLNPDGSLDGEFNAATPNETVVNAMELASDGKVLIATQSAFADFTRGSIFRLLGETNLPPTCEILLPSPSQTFRDDQADIITIRVHASDTDGSVVSVEAFADEQSLGVLTGPAADNPIFEWNWPTPSIGKHRIRALATDNRGAQSFSAPVEITVLQTASPILALMTLTKPASSSHFTAPASIEVALNITALDPKGDPHHIEFYANTQLIGSSDCGPCESTRVQTFQWTNVPVGQYTIVAKGKAPSDSIIESKNALAITVENPVVVSIGAGLSFTSEPIPNTPEIPGRIVVSRGEPIDAPLTVALAYSGSARNGIDVEQLPDVAVLDVGKRSAVIIVRAKSDAEVEDTETLVATIVASRTSSYTIDPAHASATISIRDVPPNPVPVVGIEATVPETSESFRVPIPPGAFNITRSGGESEALQVFLFVNGSATPGTDYAPIPTVLEFPVGETQIEILVEPVDDSRVEGDENVTVLLVPPPDSGASEYSIDPLKAMADVIIHDNDWHSPATIQIKHESETALNLSMVGSPGDAIILESSTNLRDWTQTDMIYIPVGGIKTQRQDFSESARFYRLRSP